MKNILLIILTIVINTIGFAQNQDCMNAVQICSGANLTTNPIGSGIVDPVNDGCLSGESSSAWYILNISSSGILTFTIDPQGRTDYDFALWGPFNTVNCNTMGAPIRCSFADPSNCANGARYNTGIRTADTDLSENGSAICFTNGSLTGVVNGFTSAVNTFAGERYVLLINNYDNNSRNFTLSFPSITAGLSCGTLPIIFNYITGYSENEFNVIDASIAYQKDIKEINIYKIIDNKQIFLKTITDIEDFKYTDIAYSEMSLYKVVTINFNGEIETSNTIEIYNNNYKRLILQPNPVIDNLVISDTDLNFELFTIEGKLLFSGFDKIVNFKDYSPGLYYLKIDNVYYKISKN
jgi:hypothetical protein